MPVQVTLPVHPRFGGSFGQQFAESSYCKAYDRSNSYSEDHRYLVPVSRTVMVEYADGKRRRHYKGDATIIEAQFSGARKYYDSKETIAALGFKFSKRNNRYMRHDDPLFYGNERLLNYHSSAARADHSEDSHWKIGLEVEKNDSTYQLDEFAWKIFEETGWAKERDGSLGANGFEMVSPILPMTDKKKLKQSLKLVQKYMDCASDSRCGGHINISCKDKTPKVILEELKSSAGFLYAIYKNRLNNNYCAVRPWAQYFSAPTKYSAFFVKNHVLEIRLFPAVKNTKSLLWRVDLLKVLLTNIKGDFIKKLASLKMKKSWLVWQLSKIYSAADIKRIANDAVYYQHKHVQPFTDAEKTKLMQMGYGSAISMFDPAFVNNYHATNIEPVVVSHVVNSRSYATSITDNVQIISSDGPIDMDFFISSDL